MALDAESFIFSCIHFVLAIDIDDCQESFALDSNAGVESKLIHWSRMGRIRPSAAFCVVLGLGLAHACYYSAMNMEAPQDFYYR